ncbi:MAG TPA: hypothetical protein PLZ06_04680 [Clostridia bacterium]|nr:hypothetical protein [Clostridia bacterium]HQC68256.1 hypothetical protein [Clostridia bacterium]
MKKTNMIIAVALTVIITALLLASCDGLSKKEEGLIDATFSSDIVIKRVDGKQPANIPYKYTKALLSDNIAYIDGVQAVNISSRRYNIKDNDISVRGDRDLFVSSEEEKAAEVMGSIKYCKGITSLCTIVADKGKSKVEFYAGYSEEYLTSVDKAYVIIPSSIGELINEEIPDSDKRIVLEKGAFGITYFTIIGEYEVKDRSKNKGEPDTLYLSYAGFGNLINMGEEIDISFVDCLAIDADEQADLTKLTYCLTTYFADANTLSQYEGRINMFNENYSYMYENSVNMKSLDLSPDTDCEKKIITVSRIDGKSDLDMSYVYADALVRDYDKYSQYITDINISTGLGGHDPYENAKLESIDKGGGFIQTNFILDNADGLNISFASSSTGFRDAVTNMITQNRKDALADVGKGKAWKKHVQYLLHQPITSISEIERMKSNSEVTFYTNYTNRDLVVQRKEDYIESTFKSDGDIKGYAIIPKTMHDAASNLPDLKTHILYLSEKNDAVESNQKVLVGFKVIGYYETDDRYDVVYITYAGSNDKYTKERFRNDYINSVTIETKKDTDITPLLEYLEQYFVPATDTSKCAGKKNALGRDYEYCYTIKSNAD